MKCKRGSNICRSGVFQSVSLDAANDAINISLMGAYGCYVGAAWKKQGKIWEKSHNRRLWIENYRSAKDFQSCAQSSAFSWKCGAFCLTGRETSVASARDLFNILLSMETFGLASWRTAGSHRWRDRGILPLRLINNFQIQNVSLSSSKGTHVVKSRADSQNHTWAMWTAQKVKQSGSDWLIG